VSVNVGLIGAGAMGSAHVATIAGAVAAARVVAVADVDLARAAAVARAGGASAIHGDPRDLIADPAVDAVLIASITETHEELALAAIDARKPVFCEKPLAETADGARRVVEAEAALGRELVRLGFMRRYDAGYLELKRLLDEGEVGDPLLVHCAHRNPGLPGPFGSEKALTESVVHEVDIVRWLLGQEIAAVTVLAPRPTRHAPPGIRDPMLVLLETDGGVLVDVESFIRARYGYDIRCEVVGETGTLALAPPSPAVPASYQERFAEAYRDELQAWVDGLRDGRPSGPTAWDGYAASAVTDACLRSLASGERTDVRLEPRPG
jgi:myo-inositol 2-dehydrogenase / D-chiro-inositol 1-dehydrogenase